jgi:hypothetical protein
MNNPLSRERLESALAYVIEVDSTMPDWETIKAALQFLLNPEPTEEMIVKMVYGDDTDLPKDIFKAMIAELTKEE